MSRLRLLAVTVATSCYGPTIHSGSPCVLDTDCPDELVCSPASMSCEPTAIDAAGPRDGPGDGPGATVCYGAGFVQACFATPPTGVIALTGTFDTDTDSRCQAIAGACAVVGADISVTGPASLTVTGSRALLLVASQTIAVQGAIDVSSRRTLARTGPAADPASCAGITAQLLPLGGPGGSFTTQGGDGGQAGLLVGQQPGPTSPATSLRGGCPGGTGGATPGGVGGHGGGAVYLIAAASLVIDSTIDASGAGGAGAGSGSAAGGGGGGAGGLIALDAPSIVVAPSAAIYANGGGGGAGGDTAAGPGGADPSAPLSPAGGGAGSGSGGSGGTGSVGAADGAGGGSGLASGGGGGGGAGAVRVFPLRNLAGNISPPPS